MTTTKFPSIQITNNPAPAFQVGEILTHPNHPQNYRVVHISERDGFATVLGLGDGKVYGSWLLPEQGWTRVA